MYMIYISYTEGSNVGANHPFHEQPGIHPPVFSSLTLVISMLSLLTTSIIAQAFFYIHAIIVV